MTYAKLNYLKLKCSMQTWQYSIGAEVELIRWKSNLHYNKVIYKKLIINSYEDIE